MISSEMKDFNNTFREKENLKVVIIGLLWELTFGIFILGRLLRFPLGGERFVRSVRGRGMLRGGWARVRLVMGPAQPCNRLKWGK